jgi:hypothetical protein
MAKIKCTLCGLETESSFFEHWNCYDCGVDYGIRLLSFEGEELTSVFEFLAALKAGARPVPVTQTVVLSKLLENTADQALPSFLDSLLLFFDSLIIPDLTNDQLSKVLGDKKYATYRGADLIRTSDNSYVHANAVGMATLPSELNPRYPLLWDHQLLDPDLENLFPSPLMSVRYDLFRLIENLEKIYLNDLLVFLRKTDLFNQNRIGDSEWVRLRGQKYRDSDLIGIVPKRFVRNELFSYIFSADLLADDYYGIAFALREMNYTLRRSAANPSWQAFKEWIRTTPLRLRELEAEAVLEFRAKYGSLRPFVTEVLESVTEGCDARTRDMTNAVASEINRRVLSADRVFGKAHERKKMFLSGLFGTLGSLIGGPVGAVVGGVGGTAVAEAALQYDRKIPGPISWLATEFVRPF